MKKKEAKGLPRDMRTIARILNRILADDEFSQRTERAIAVHVGIPLEWVELARALQSEKV